MKIALDSMGGDHAPLVNLEGARDILAENSEIESIILTGPVEQLKEAAQNCGLTDPRATFVEASEVVGMEESGAKALRRKKNSSISIAAELVKKGDAQALVSAGNTGAAVAVADGGGSISTQSESEPASLGSERGLLPSRLAQSPWPYRW